MTAISKHRIRFDVLLCLIILHSSGCASIFSKSKYPVEVESRPTAAKVTITNKKGEQVHTGVTPFTVTLKSDAGYFKRGRYTLKFEKAGYEPAMSTLTASLDPWYYGSIFFPFFGLLVIDPATGAMWKLQPQVFVDFEDNKKASP